MADSSNEDDEAEAVISHLTSEGGKNVGLSPRVLVRGRYEGDGGILMHFRRRIDEGTYLHVDLKVGDEEVCHAVLDMCYPYGLSKSIEKPGCYDGIWRQTLTNQKTQCRTWIGFGYTAGEDGDYVDCSEHVLPRSEGYEWHSASCNKKVAGEWNWCTGGSSCGKMTWKFLMTIFETNEEQLGQEKMSVELTTILYNKDNRGRQKVEMRVNVNGVVKGSARSVDKNDASLSHYSKDKLKRSATIFIKSRRDWARATLPPHKPAYLSKVYGAPEALTGVLSVHGAEDKPEAMLRALLQLFNCCQTFNLRLLVQVLHGQLDVEARSWLLVEALHAVLEGGNERSVADCQAQLCHLPLEEVPYNDQTNYPEILVLLLRLLLSLQRATAEGKREPEIMTLMRKTFEMKTSWAPVEGCGVCGNVPIGQLHKWHFPDLVLRCKQDIDGQPIDLMEALKKRVLEENRRKLDPCRWVVRCR